MAAAALALIFLTYLTAVQAQVGGQCTTAELVPWPVPGNIMAYYLCVDGRIEQLDCPKNTIFIATNLNVFGCIPSNLVTCQYNPSGNYWSNNNYYPYNYQNSYNPPVLYPNEVGNNQNGYSTVFVPGSNNNNGYLYPGYSSYYNPNGIPGAVSDGNVIVVPAKK